MNSRRQSVIEGLKQAAWVFRAILLLAGIGWIGLFTFSPIQNQVISWFFELPARFGSVVLIGPSPTLLTLFDITNSQLFILSGLLIIPYWVCLGIIAGLQQRLYHNTDSNQDQDFFSDKAAKQIRWNIVILSIILAFVFWSLLGPNFISDGRYSAGAYENRAINNLRQVDAARNEFVLEKTPPTNYIVTEADIMPYIKLNSDGKIPRLGQMRYVLNPIDKPVYAVLESDCRFPRRGWHEGFTFTNGTIFRPP